VCKNEVACFASEIYIKGREIFSMSMKNEILLLVICTIKETQYRLCTKMGRKIKTGISDKRIDFHRLNYTGNVAAKHLKVACGPTGFCGTKFENHWDRGLTAFT